MQIKSVSFFLPGKARVGAEFFAEDIGLDDGPGWGKVRFDSLVFGILMSACSVFHSLYTDTALSASHNIQFHSPQP